MTYADDTKLDERAVKRLDAASLWLITDAAGQLYSDPSFSETLPNELIEKYKLTFLNSPKLNGENHILRYIIKSRGIYYDIELLQDAEYQKQIYEYWKIYISSKSWATKQGNECRFLVTRSTDKFSQRQIIKDEKQFFHSCDVGDTEVLNLNYLDDLKLRYKLRPWLLKEYFKDYPEINQTEIILLPDGSYVEARE